MGRAHPLQMKHEWDKAKNGGMSARVSLEGLIVAVFKHGMPRQADVLIYPEPIMHINMGQVGTYHRNLSTRKITTGMLWMLWAVVDGVVPSNNGSCAKSIEMVWKKIQIPISNNSNLRM